MAMVTTVTAMVTTVTAMVTTVTAMVTTVTAMVATVMAMVTTVMAMVATVTAMVTTVMAMVTTVMAMVATVMAMVATVMAMVATVMAMVATVMAMVTTVMAMVTTVVAMVYTAVPIHVLRRCPVQISLPVLDRLRIASPCAMTWDRMSGDDRVRHCADCGKNVYNLSNMSREEATRLLIEREGTICVGIARRADGTVITDDCPVGLRALRRRMRRFRSVAAAALAFLLGGLTGCGARQDEAAEAEAKRKAEQAKSEKINTQFGLPMMENK